MDTTERARGCHTAGVNLIEGNSALEVKAIHFKEREHVVLGLLSVIDGSSVHGWIWLLLILSAEAIITGVGVEDLVGPEGILVLPLLLGSWEVGYVVVGSLSSEVRRSKENMRFWS